MDYICNELNEIATMENITFKEYCNQEQPVRQAAVLVRESDCKRIYPTNLNGDRIVDLEIHDKVYQYLLRKNDDRLYTIEEGSNTSKASCFVWHPLRVVKVIYEDGSEIVTSMAAKLSDEEIKAYFKVGEIFNIGSINDNMQAVKECTIIL